MNAMKGDPIICKCGNAASSHSGRRWFATNAARQGSTVGGSLRYVQMLRRLAGKDLVDGKCPVIWDKF